MLSFVAALLRTDNLQYASEFDLQERAKAVFTECDADADGKLSKQDTYNYLLDRRINVSHLAQEKHFRQLSGGADFLSLQQFLQARSMHIWQLCAAVLCILLFIGCSRDCTSTQGS